MYKFSSKVKTVSVVGLGYIGLPTATIFAGHGLKVIGVDVNPVAVETINRGEIHFVEPELDRAVHDTVSKGLLYATTSPEPADAFLIAVPTPFKGENHEPDLSYIEAACHSIAPHLKAGNMVVLESTSPVGATEKMAEWLASSRPDLSFPQQAGELSDVRIAHCPERVLPGQVMRELVQNDRIIGGMTPKCAHEAVALYRVFVEGECLVTDVRTAEMCKLAENAFRDTNIAYANELSIVCEKMGVDVWELIRLANRHPRVNILQPGAGVGGHCIAVDPWFIVSGAGGSARLIEAARHVNDSKPAWILEKVSEAASCFERQNSGKKPVVAVFGLAFKPDIDDLRESPALRIAQALHDGHGDRLVVVEPNIEKLPTTLSAAQLLSIDAALEKGDIVVLLVNHSVFSSAEIFRKLKDAVVVDAVGLLHKETGQGVHAKLYAA